MLVVIEEQVVIGSYPEVSRFNERVCYRNRRLSRCLGAVLTQENKIEGEKIFMPVLYTSRSLKGAERL